MGNPINAVAWLANKLHEYGVTPEAGPRDPVGLVHQGHPVPGRRHRRGLVRRPRRGHLPRGVGTCRSIEDHRPCDSASPSATPTWATTRASSRSTRRSVEGAGFDHLLAAEHVVGGHPDRLRGEKVHTYDVAVPRAVRAVRLPRRGHPAPGAGHRDPDPAAAPDGAGGQAGRRARPAHRRSAAARRRRRPELDGVRGARTRTSRTGAPRRGAGRGAPPRCGRRSWSPSTGAGTTSTASA